MEQSNRSRVIIGTILVLIGVIFLLDNLGYDINLPWYIFRWPAILVLIGVMNLVTGNIRAAFILIGLGAIFYLDVFDILSIGQLWPIILIIIGLSFLFRTNRRLIQSEGKEDFIDEIVIFSGSDKIIKSDNFLGGKVTGIFGGSKIDLRGSKIKDTATIDLFCMFGGTELQVPSNWKVSTNATTILGGVSDERKNVDENTQGTLIINGFVILGGGTLKS